MVLLVEPEFKMYAKMPPNPRNDPLDLFGSNLGACQMLALGSLALVVRWQMRGDRDRDMVGDRSSSAGACPTR